MFNMCVTAGSQGSGYAASRPTPISCSAALRLPSCHHLQSYNGPSSLIAGMLCSDNMQAKAHVRLNSFRHDIDTQGLLVQHGGDM